MNTRDPVDILARTVWAEARGEGRRGMEAVAAVAMNRVRHPDWWGRTVVGVCTAPYQFSCWNAGDPNKPKLISVTGADPAFVTALAVAQQAVDGTLIDPTHGADSYYAHGTSEPAPAWAIGREPCAVIGRHWFYRLEVPLNPPAEPSTHVEPPSPLYRDDPAADVEAADELNAAELRTLT